MAWDIVGRGYYPVAGQDRGVADLLAIAGAEVPAPMREQVLEQALARTAVAVQERPPYKSREYPLGFDSGALIAAGGSALITSRPQVVFRVERLVVPSDIGGAFVINDVTVGKNSQYAAATPVPARVYDENAVGVRLRGDTAQVSMDVTLNVTNISGAGVRFRAAIIGTAVE